jgi:hypothetical protein
MEQLQLIKELRCDELKVLMKKEHYKGKGEYLIEKKCKKY